MSTDVPEPNEPPERMPAALRLRVATAAALMAVAFGSLFWIGIEHEIPRATGTLAQQRRAAGQELRPLALEAVGLLVYALPVPVALSGVVLGQAIAGRKTRLMCWMMANLKGFDPRT